MTSAKHTIGYLVECSGSVECGPLLARTSEQVANWRKHIDIGRVYHVRGIPNNKLKEDK